MAVITDKSGMSTHKTTRMNLHSREILSSIAKSQHDRQWIIFAFQLLYVGNAIFVYHFTRNIPWSRWLQRASFYPFAIYLIFAIWCLVRSRIKALKTYEVVASMALDFWICANVLSSFKSISIGNTLVSAMGGVADFSPETFFTFVFPLITLRCLHFTPLYVILAGGMATLVWLNHLLLRIYTPGGPVSHVSTLHLVTASADKLASIGVVTFVLVICVREARRHLLNATIRAAAGRSLTRMVGSDVAKEVLFSRKNLTPGKGRRETAAILMIDLQDFTQIAYHADPSDVLSLLAKYQQMVEPVITKNGGHIDKFMGDGILAHFGAIDPSFTFAAGALRCMEGLLIKMDQWNDERRLAGKTPLYYRMSCDIGTVVVGLVGGESKVEFTLIGDPVNIAAKLEKHSKKLDARALTTLRAFKMAENQGFAPLRPIQVQHNCAVEGIADPLDLVVIAKQQRHSSKIKLKKAS